MYDNVVNYNFIGKTTEKKSRKISIEYDMIILKFGIVSAGLKKELF